MSLVSLISDFYSSLTVSEVHADASSSEIEEQPTSEQPKESVKLDSSVADEKEQEVEEEEEEEEEPEDPFPALQEECANSKECLPAKHHYDDCVERVTSAAESEDSKGPKEDCVEEFFHLMHCSTQCAAPKLFAKLK
ncbi:ubiquinol-cytochrome c reductase subunit 6 [Geopyxis carbonaria]|nr:ubiquinol-cytochrome c reductase subunit 6 [Geopyxis carbonaria]